MSRRSAAEESGGPDRVAVGIAVAGLLLHLPFLLRYDLHFQPDFAVSMQISRAIVQGARPIFWWGQSYLGTLGNYLTAGLFAVFGESIPLAGSLPLAVWAAGVALASATGARLFGRRAGVWTAVVAAVGSPYANHYVAMPYSSYEAAAVLSVLAIAAVPWTGAAVAHASWGRVVATWGAVGGMFGLGWWTTRLFAPTLLAWALGTLLAVRWRRPPLERLVVGAAALAAGFTLGDLPELLYRAHPAAYAVGPERPVALSDVAGPGTALANAGQALRSLPAYLGGDRRARVPEGVRFAEILQLREPPPPPPGPGSILDACAIGALALAVGAALVMMVDGWRSQQPALVALGLVPFIHFALVVLSARTGGGYFEARRYWFAMLLILPMLLGGAVAIAERFGNPVRAAVCALLVTVACWSAISQVRMLGLPDELAAHRALADDLLRHDVRYVVMPTWTASVLDPLSHGQLAVVTIQDDRNPAIAQAASAAQAIALVARPAGALPPEFSLGEGRFARAGAAQRIAQWRWARYDRRDDASHE
jgi:hypothetical protein